MLLGERLAEEFKLVCHFRVERRRWSRGEERTRWLRGRRPGRRRGPRQTAHLSCPRPVFRAVVLLGRDTLQVRPRNAARVARELATAVLGLARRAGHRARRVEAALAPGPLAYAEGGGAGESAVSSSGGGSARSVRRFRTDPDAEEVGRVDALHVGRAPHAAVRAVPARLVASSRAGHLVALGAVLHGQVPGRVLAAVRASPELIDALPRPQGAGEQRRARRDRRAAARTVHGTGPSGSADFSTAPGCRPFECRRGALPGPLAPPWCPAATAFSSSSSTPFSASAAAAVALLPHAQQASRAVRLPVPLTSPSPGASQSTPSAQRPDLE